MALDRMDYIGAALLLLAFAVVWAFGQSRIDVSRPAAYTASAEPENAEAWAAPHRAWRRDEGAVF